MSVITTYAPNTFGCPGLCSGDAAAAKAFYPALFDWEAKDMSMPCGGDFTMFKLQGDDVAGMYQMADARKQAGVKPHWNSYLCVKSVEETVARAEQLGAKILAKPFDADGDVMANLQDPTGAKFSIWEARKTPDSARILEPGALCWSELYTTDAKSSADFYSGLFGWLTTPFDGGPMPYTIFQREPGDMGLGGMVEIMEHMKPMEPQWVPYFMVQDAKAKADRARELGAEVWGPCEIPTVGSIVMLKDTEGAMVAFIHPTM